MLVTALTIAEITYLVVLSLWIILEKRPPVATLAWILSLAALPVAGFAIYYLFGPRRIHRRRLKRQRARLKVRGASERDLGRVVFADEAALTAPARALMTLAAGAGDMPPAACHRVDLLTSGADCFEAICEAVAAARHHVHLAYYIFEPDHTGTRLRDLLVQKAKEGVQVRLLVDDVGSHRMGRRFVKPLLAAGGSFARFNAVGLPRFRPRVNFRNHRKILVCDGRVAFTGGMNISDAYSVSSEGGVPWRDTHLRLEGTAVRWLQLVFLEDWYFATDHAPHGNAYFPRDPGDTGPSHVLQVVASGPDSDWQSIHKLYFAAIAGAQRRVLITTPYFVPDEAMLVALVTAALRGVDVRLLVPRRGDSRIVTAAARSYYDDLLRAGVRIFEYLPSMLHAKTMVVDDSFATVGTANMDNRSFRLNFEVSVALYGTTFVDQLVATFAEDVAKAEEVNASRRQQMRWPDRFGEAGARLFSPLL